MNIDSNNNHSMNVKNSIMEEKKVKKEGKKEKEEKKEEKEEKEEKKEMIHSEIDGIPEFVLNLMENQPTLNIMTCGDVTHGKSTLIQALTGEKTGRFKDEKERNMTIRLGYSSCKIFKCLLCPRPDCYFSTKSSVKLSSLKCPNKDCSANLKENNIILVRHLSFVDVPGHQDLMQTMISATSVSDAALFVIDGSQKCPGTQASQHMIATHLLGLYEKNNEFDYHPLFADRIKIIAVQNKIDLINKQKACISANEIRSFLEIYSLSNTTPIIPISAQSKLNIDVLCMYIINKFPANTM